MVIFHSLGGFLLHALHIPLRICDLFLIRLELL